MSEAPPSPAAFSEQVRLRFARQAAEYERQADLQRAIAWRLAHLIRPLPLPEGPCADLGAGTGLLGQALQQQAPGAPGLPPRLLQLDLCAELLDYNPLPCQRQWDLQRGLPPELAGAALLCSSFALQWLPEPAQQLQRWCESLRPGGWLLLAVPTAASFPEWHRAAARAGVPCTALALPPAAELFAAAAGLQLQRQQILRFRRRYGSAQQFLARLKRLGASAGSTQRLSPGQLRRLLRCWPGDGQVSWEVLLLLGRKPAAP